jgi:CheY-like chemotaxis protein
MQHTDHQFLAGNDPRSGMRLAVIDDEDRWLKVFKRMFRNTVYELDTYSDPRAFLDAIEREPKRYSGVICDIKMPQISGYQVFESLKQNPFTADIPFVLVSGVLTEDQNLSRAQGIAHISKLDNDMRSKVFDELIEIIENWHQLKSYLCQRRTAVEDIAFFQQFYVNYHLFFGRILEFVRRMEVACVNADAGEAARIRTACTGYLEELHRRCMDLIDIAKDCPCANHFVAKICARARTNLNMLLMFKIQLGDIAPADSEFPALLEECRQSLEKIISGSEQGYNLRGQL